METMLFFIPILVLISSIIIGLSGNFINNFYSGIISTILVFVSFVLSLVLCSSFYFSTSEIFYEDLYKWISVNNFHITIGYLIDKLSAIMIAVVLFISLVVHIYSIGYMKDEKNFKRFFSYIALFTFSMLLLVMSNNLIQLFIGWEGVGLVSYLLIGYWHNKESAIKASLKAFLINRVGDMFFILGIAMIYSAFGSFDFKTIFTNIDYIDSYNLENYFGLTYIDFSCLFLFIGAMAKSAQIPLHVWLPDSMEGPTPISALIHAATMVTAGIFMVARLSPLYVTTAFTADFILIIGASTALFIGAIAIFENDIKKVIAYSTISQLGFMVAALGISAYTVSFFHLFTHAFFKALLFLCAGSIIMSLHHNQNIQDMGGLKSKLPVTYICFLIGTLSIIGFPLTSGFFSKDLILEVMLYENNTISYIAYYMLLAGALVTTIYSFRLLFLVFYGKYKNGNLEKITEQSAIILLPLILLAISSLLAGYFINVFIELPIFMHEINIINYNGLLNFIIHGILSPTTITLFIGFYIAKLLYKDNKKYKLFRFKIIEFFKQTVLSKYKFDEFFILSSKKIVMLSSYFSKKYDIALIDGFFVNGIPKKINNFSEKLKNISTGYLYHYAFSIVFSLVIIFGVILVRII